MKKVLVVTAALLITVPMAASAGEVIGRIQAVDRASHAFVLEDGTRLWVDEGRLVDLRDGATVQVIYAEEDGKNVVTDLVIWATVDGTGGTDLGGPRALFDDRSIQTSD